MVDRSGSELEAAQTVGKRRAAPTPSVEIIPRHGLWRGMAAEERIQVSLRRSTVDTLRSYDPSAETLDDVIEELLIDHPPKALLEELDRRETEPTISLEETRRKHGY
jgi:hypothetical protein